MKTYLEVKWGILISKLGLVLQSIGKKIKGKSVTYPFFCVIIKRIMMNEKEYDEYFMT